MQQTFCSAGSSLSHVGSDSLYCCSCFRSSLHRLTRRWPHIAPPAHVSVHLHRGRFSPARPSGFYWPSNQTSHYLLSTCAARKVWNHFVRDLWVQTTAPVWGKLWRLAVDSGTCKVIFGMQVKKCHGIKKKKNQKKNPPSSKKTLYQAKTRQEFHRIHVNC